MTTSNTIVVAASKSPNLDTLCYRGSAPLADLTRATDADVFDQVTNPDGLQRDLSPKHAAEAYAYAAREPDEAFPRAFPEVILNVRDESVVNVRQVKAGAQKKVDVYEITFDLDAIEANEADGKVSVSRVDGNHRLYFGNGDERGREPLEVMVPFQIHVGLTPEQEANLFVDVNANQKGLNSSHLHTLRARLTPEEIELAQHPERVFARRLAEDENSPWYGLVHMGGSRAGTKAAGEHRPVSFTALEGGVKRTLSKSQYIHDLKSPDAQYALIRNYWLAVKAVFPYEFEEARDYLLLKAIGVASLSILGGTIIDRCMARGEVEIDSMVAYVKQVRGVFDWSKDAIGERSVSGMSGNRAALIVAGELASSLVEPGESRALSTLEDRLLNEAMEAGVAAKAAEAEARAAHPQPEGPLTEEQTAALEGAVT